MRMRDRPFIVCNPFNMVSEIIGPIGLFQSYSDHCTPSNSSNSITCFFSFVVSLYYETIVGQNE